MPDSLRLNGHSATFDWIEGWKDDLMACLWAGYRKLYEDPSNERYIPDYEKAMLSAGITLEAIGAERTKLQDGLTPEQCTAHITARADYLASLNYKPTVKSTREKATEGKDITVAAPTTEVAQAKKPRGKKQAADFEAKAKTDTLF